MRIFFKGFLGGLIGFLVGVWLMSNGPLPRDAPIATPSRPITYVVTATPTKGN